MKIFVNISHFFELFQFIKVVERKNEIFSMGKESANKKKEKKIPPGRNEYDSRE